ncbi:MAG: putative PEP-binding protein [bacterium]
MDEQYGGRALTTGIGIGPASVLPGFSNDEVSSSVSVDDPEQEIARFEEALHETLESTRELRREAENVFQDQLAELFSVQEHMLQDPMFVAGVKEIIKEQSLPAEPAILRALNEIEDTFLNTQSNNPSVRDRASEVIDIGWRVLRQLNADNIIPHLPHGGVVIARKIIPSQAIHLRNTNVTGIVVQGTDRGSHTAIVAQALEVPAVGVAQTELFAQVQPGDELIVSCKHNTVYRNPDASVRKSFENAREKHREIFTNIRSRAREVPESSTSFEIRGNIGFLSECELVQRYGGNGTGLVRTELMAMAGDLNKANDEQQFRTYSTIADNFSPHPVCVRTWDEGGDKEIEEDKVISGNRGGRGIVRSLMEGDAFERQLKALSKAYENHDNLRILVPMVGSPKEVEQIRTRISEFDVVPPLGIMVEVPSLVYQIDYVADSIDFLSIGSNDLTYNLVGSDRFQEDTIDVVEAPVPALFRFIKDVVDRAEHHNLDVHLCGELAGNPLYTPALMGLGIDEVSVPPIRIPRVKLVSHRAKKQVCNRFAEQILGQKHREQLNEWVSGTMEPYIRDLLKEDETWTSNH